MGCDGGMGVERSIADHGTMYHDRLEGLSPKLAVFSARAHNLLGTY